MSDFEVVRSDVEGWDVRRTGEAQALSNYPTRELAEAAARKQQEAEHRSGGTADPIDVRQDVFSEGPDEELHIKRTLFGTGTVLVAVIALIVLAALFVVITGVTNGP
ncbi:MAG: DUF2188 domain-containing protein [Solirubrobacterales bacterium]|nr:DUF2188 domain-containing protein [Solirubrobacterales bacterium]